MIRRYRRCWTNGKTRQRNVKAELLTKRYGKGNIKNPCKEIYVVKLAAGHDTVTNFVRLLLSQVGESEDGEMFIYWSQGILPMKVSLHSWGMEGLPVVGRLPRLFSRCTHSSVCILTYQPLSLMPMANTPLRLRSGGRLFNGRNGKTTLMDGWSHNRFRKK